MHVNQACVYTFVELLPHAEDFRGRQRPRRALKAMSAAVELNAESLDGLVLAHITASAAKVNTSADQKEERIPSSFPAAVASNTSPPATITRRRAPPRQRRNCGTCCERATSAPPPPASLPSAQRWHPANGCRWLWRGWAECAAALESLWDMPAAAAAVRLDCSCAVWVALLCSLQPLCSGPCSFN